MRTAASWFRSPWDLPNTRMWRATFAATPEQARLDRLAVGLLLSKRPLVNPDGARAYRRARARRGVGLLEMICVLNDLSDGHYASGDFGEGRASVATGRESLKSAGRPRRAELRQVWREAVWANQ